MRPLTVRLTHRIVILATLAGPWACAGAVNYADGTGGNASGGAVNSGDDSFAGESSGGGSEAADGGGSSESGGAASGGAASSGGGPTNECALDTDNCDENASCTDTTQSFTCACNDGYSGNGTVTNCIDINECQNDTHDCSPQAKCTNTSGSFSCECRPGYSGTGKQCSDIDECATGADDCSQYANCDNTDGAFTCECKSGYSGSGQECSDINECTMGMHNCNEHAACTNNSGSFACACTPPYFGDGMSCSCRAKSSTNVIVQGGLNTSASVGDNTGGLAIWSNDNGGSWASNQDAENCPDSGALLLIDTTTKIYATTTICVPVQGDTSYRLGLKYKRTEGGKFACQPVYYSEPNCASGIGYGEPTISIPRASTDDASWLSASSAVGLSPTNAKSAVLYCRSELASNDPVSATYIYLDQIYFNSSAAQF